MKKPEHRSNGRVTPVRRTARPQVGQVVPLEGSLRSRRESLNQDAQKINNLIRSKQFNLVLDRILDDIDRVG